MWTAPNTSDPYFGLILQWVNIQKGKWVFCDEVGVLHKILGRHSGDNLGKYFMLILDHVGVTSETHSKVSPLYLFSSCANPLHT